MEQQDFTLLHVSEIPFKMNLDVKEISDEIKKKLRIAFLFVLQYQKGNKTSALHSVVRITLDNNVILAGGATLIFNSKKWDEMPHDKETVRKSDFAKELVGYALPYISGLMFARTQDTKLKELFLPAINPTELVSNIRVEEI